MLKKRSIRFVFAFIAVVAAIAIGLVLQRPKESTVDSMDSSSTNVPATPEPSVVATTAAPANESSAPTTPVAHRTDLAPLPRVDLAAYCEQTAGSRELSGAAPTSCRGVHGQDVAIDVAAACRAQFGPSSRSLRADVCTPLKRVEVGTPDPDVYCHRNVADTATAFLKANDQWGWRCASVKLGVFAITDISMDHACQQQVGTESFAETISGTPQGWRCWAQG